jgi:ELWxxDGT repeat protein
MFSHRHTLSYRHPIRCGMRLATLLVAWSMLFAATVGQTTQAAGPASPLQDSVPGPAGAFPNGFAAIGDTIYFTTFDPLSTQRVLWKNDGVTTAQIAVPGSIDGSLIAVGNQIFFNVSGLDSRIWKTDGFTAEPVSNSVWVDEHWRVERMIAGSTNLFVFARANFGGQRVWTTDGVTLTQVSGPIRDDVDAWIGLSRVALGDTLFFIACDDSPYSYACAIKKTDGGPVVDVVPYTPYALRVIDGSLYAISSGLMKFNGTSFVPLSLSGQTYPDPSELAIVGTTLFFIADDGVHGYQLSAMDGTMAGARRLSNFSDTVPFNDDEHSSRNIRNLVAAGDQVLFVADDDVHGRELWISDGRSVTLLKDINSGMADSMPSEFRSVGSGVRLVFSADDGVHGRELWQTDGTPEGTTLLQDIAPGSASSDPTSLTLAGDRLLFVADDTSIGKEVWFLPTSAVNSAPAAHDGSLATLAGAAVSGQLSGSDGNHDRLTFRIVTDAGKGQVTLINVAAGTFSYQPGPGSIGADSFRFVVSDGYVDSQPATVRISIQPRQLYMPLVHQ